MKIQAGSNWPRRSPREQATHTAKAKAKNHSRRSRQKTARPPTITARKPQPMYAAEASGAPSYPLSGMKEWSADGYAVVTKLEGMKPPITPTLGQTRPWRWAGPSRANHTGQASRTAPKPRPTPRASAAWGRRADSAGGSATSGAEHERHQADDDHDRADGQQFRGEEELAEEKQREQGAAAEGPVALPDQDLVEDGQDQREQHRARPS